MISLSWASLYKGKEMVPLVVHSLIFFKFQEFFTEILKFKKSLTVLPTKIKRKKKIDTPSSFGKRLMVPLRLVLFQQRTERISH